MAKEKLWLVAWCVVGFVPALRTESDLGGSEFMGGSVTGPLFNLLEIGLPLFVLAFVLAFGYPRIAGIVAGVAGLCCVPVYLYFTAPGPFRWFFKGEYAIPLRSNFVVDEMSILGMVAAVVIVFTAIWMLAAPARLKP